VPCSQATPMRRLITAILLFAALVSIGASQSPPPSPTPAKTSHEKQKASSSKTDETKSAHESPSVPPVNIQVIADETDNPSKQESKKSPTDWWLTAFTGALVLVAVLQFLAMHRQAGYMRKGLRISISAARAAKQSAIAAKESADAALLNARALKSAERAHIDAELTQTAPGGSVYRFTVTNFGKSPAIITIWGLARYHFPADQNILPDDLHESGNMVEERQAVNQMLPVGPVITVREIDIFRYLNEKQRSGTEQVFFNVYVEYQDIFKDTHETDIVYSYSVSKSALISNPRYNRYT